MKAPNPNANISGICKFFRTVSMYSYWFKKSNMKDPEIPGNIIAHIAMTPEKKMTGKECPSPSLAISANTKAHKNPTTKNNVFLIDKHPELL